jgi:hypothetical protein
MIDAKKYRVAQSNLLAMALKFHCLFHLSEDASSIEGQEINSYSIYQFV